MIILLISLINLFVYSVILDVLIALIIQQIVNFVLNLTKEICQINVIVIINYSKARIRHAKVKYIIYILNSFEFNNSIYRLQISMLRMY